MVVRTAELRLYAPWVHSLKEKRMVVKSLLAKTRARFGISAAEVDAQDVHQTIVLGLACVSDSLLNASEIIDGAVRFIGANTEAEVTDVLLETR